MSVRLLADALQSCQRECVEATETELCERIGRRIGLAGDEVARSVRLINGGTVSFQSPSPSRNAEQNLEETLAADAASPEEDVILRLDHAKALRRITALVHEILGERERVVFLARCMGRGEDITHVETLARRFGVTRERICQLEASAKRKIAIALGREGYTHVTAGQTVRLPPSRARRRRPALPALPPAAQLPQVAAAG